MAPPISDRVDFAMQPHVALQSLLQCRRQALLLRVVQRHRRGHLHVGGVLGLGTQRLEHRRDLRQQRQAAIAAPACARKLRLCSSSASPPISAIRPASWSGVTRGLEQQLGDALVLHHRRGGRQHFATSDRTRCVARAMLERCLGVGSGDGGFLGHESAPVDASAALDLQRQLVEQVGVRLGIDLATEQLARRRTPPASATSLRSCSRARLDLRAHFLARIGDQALAFGDAVPRASSTTSLERRLACSTILPARACASLMMSLAECSSPRPGSFSPRSAAASPRRSSSAALRSPR